MKRKPFVMQSICMAMILIGMHLCFYDMILQSGSRLFFAILLTLFSFWITILVTAPFSRLESAVRMSLGLRTIRNPLAGAGLLLTAVLLAVFCIWQREHFMRDVMLLSDAVRVLYDRYYAGLHRELALDAKQYHGVSGSWLLLLAELVAGYLMAVSFSAVMGQGSSARVRGKRKKLGLRRFFAAHGMFFGTLPPALLLALGLLVGKSPSIPAMILLVCGILGMQMILERQGEDRDAHFRQLTVRQQFHQRTYPLAFCLLLVLFGASGAVSHAKGDVCLQKEGELVQLQHKLEQETVTFGVRAVQKIQRMLGLEQPGVMNNITPSFSGETVLTLKTDKKPTDDIYLRGFVGTRYEDGKWSNKPVKTRIQDHFSTNVCYQLLTQDYDMYEGLLDWFSYDEQEELMKIKGKKTGEDPDLLVPDEELQSNLMHMDIKYTGNNLTTYAYLPYFAKLSEESMGTLMLDYDRGFRRSGNVRNYSVSLRQTDGELRQWIQNRTGILRNDMIVYYRKGGKSKGFILDNSNNILGEAVNPYADPDNPFVVKENVVIDKKDPRFVEISNQKLGEYLQYVVSEYGWLPDQGLERTKELARLLVERNQINLMPGATSAESLIREMQGYFQSTCQYSRKLGSVGSGEDYVEHFLFTEKKGYCEHFATAAAVLYRALGIPSRYVSGYKVSPEDFKDNGDGTYTAKVLDSDAHAWSEIYSLNEGWMVADTTPGQEGASGQGSGNVRAPFATATPFDDTEDDFLDQMDPPDRKDSPDKKNKDQKATPTPTKKPEGLGGKGSDQGGSGSGGLSKGAKGLLIAAAVIILAAAGLWVHRRRLSRLRKRRLKECRDAGAYLLEQDLQMEQFLEACGYGSLSRYGDEAYRAELEKIFPRGLEDGSLARYFMLLERIRFSRQEAGREDIKEALRLIRGIRRAAYVGQNRRQRFYLRQLLGWEI